MKKNRKFVICNKTNHKKILKLESQKNLNINIKPYFQGRFEKSKLGFELLMFYYV